MATDCRRIMLNYNSARPRQLLNFNNERDLEQACSLCSRCTNWHWMNCHDIESSIAIASIVSHTTSVGMTLILVSFFLIISHTTLVGMTLILVSFFLIIIIILFILATNWSNV